MAAGCPTAWLLGFYSTCRALWPPCMPLVRSRRTLYSPLFITFKSSSLPSRVFIMSSFSRPPLLDGCTDVAHRDIKCANVLIRKRSNIRGLPRIRKGGKDDILQVKREVRRRYRALSPRCVQRA